MNKGYQQQNNQNNAGRGYGMQNQNQGYGMQNQNQFGDPPGIEIQ